MAGQDTPDFLLRDTHACTAAAWQRVHDSRKWRPSYSIREADVYTGPRLFWKDSVSVRVRAATECGGIFFVFRYFDTSSIRRFDRLTKKMDAVKPQDPVDAILVSLSTMDDQKF